MRVLVTGGLGVIGSCIVSHLWRAGHANTVIDACEAKRNIWTQFHTDVPDSMAFIARIERNPDAVAREVKLADAVIHCAASTGIPYSVINPDDDWQSNVDATRVLLEALRKHPKPTAILSSVKPYRVPSDIIERGGLREDDVLEPDEPYAASKAAQSMLAMAYARSYDLPIVTFRCSNLYGPAPCHGPRHGWMTWFAISAAIGRPIQVQGSGNQTRDMLHADDVYTACMAALENADRLKGRVFNLGGGANNRISVIEAAQLLHELTGVEIVRGPARAMDDDHVFANYGAFLKETEWRPLVGVKEGLMSVLEWAQEHREDLAKIYEGV